MTIPKSFSEVTPNRSAPTYTDSRSNEQHKPQRDKPAVAPLPDPFVTVFECEGVIHAVVSPLSPAVLCISCSNACKITRPVGRFFPTWEKAFQAALSFDRFRFLHNLPNFCVGRMLSLSRQKVQLWQAICSPSAKGRNNNTRNPSIKS